MQLCHDLDEKNVEIRKLQNEANKIKEKIENIRSNFIDIAKEKLLNKWFIAKSPKENYNKYYLFGYCSNVLENSRDVSFECRGSRIYGDLCGRVNYEESSVNTVINYEYLNDVLILSDEQAKEINEAILETVKGEKSIKDLYNYVENYYNVGKSKNE